MQRFELLGRNGAGANSTVFKCRDAQASVVAVKKLENVSELKQVLCEAAIMRLCHGHKHCVQLLEAYQGKASGAVYLVMEHVEHSLSREILLNPRGLPVPKVKLVVYQLAQALELLHNKRVCHCDLKPANVLLTSSYSVKLCDFGSAITSATCDGDNSGSGSPPCWPSSISGASITASPQPASAPPAVRCTAAASRWYCAPESLLGGEASPASDIWALGCILAELVIGKPLMPGTDEELDQLCCVVATIGRLSDGQEQLLQLLPVEQRMRLEAARARGPLLDRMPKLTACPALSQVLRACLQPNPAARPTAQQLQALPFFEDLRQALQASEAAAAAKAAAAAAAVSVLELGAYTGADEAAAAPISLQRRTSSGAMDVDAPAGVPPPAADTAPRGTAAGCSPDGDFGADASVPAAAAPAPRRFGGVQAAAPLRLAQRPRVSALTATIRGKPFEGDGGYTDLMPQVLQLAARLEAAAQDVGLGPIAIAARRASSTAMVTSLSPAPSGELLPLGNRWSSGGGRAADSSPVAISMVDSQVSMAAGPHLSPFSTVVPAAAAAGQVCTTPIAAAAGGCGAARPAATSAAATAATAPSAPSSGASPMEPAPAAPVRPQGDVRSGAATAAAPPVAKTSIPVSSSAGSLPLMSNSLTDTAAAAAAAKAPLSALSTTQLRSRAILNRARRHHAREQRSGSVPSGGFLAASGCPRSSLGTSATLLQRELAAAAEPVGVGGAARGPQSPAIMGRSSGHATRRSFADLSELASVAEYAPLECGTPPDVKRRRGLSRQYGFQPTHGSQPSPGSLTTELSLGSLPEHEPLLEENQPPVTSRAGALAGALAAGRRMRRSSSGIGLGPAAGADSPVWRAVASRAVSMPQPIAGRGRCAGGVAHGGGTLGLAGSCCSDHGHSAVSDSYLRNGAA